MRRPLSIGLLLVLATLAVYGQVVDFDFVHIDDPEYVAANPHLRERVELADLVWASTTDRLANWHPLTWISYQLDAAIFGRDAPGAFHAVNLAFHLLGTLLCFAALRALTRRDWESAFVAGVFALHPLHVESVAWISERKDVLTGAAWWASLWAYACHARGGARRGLAYGVCLGCFALALLAKPLAVTLPCVLLLLDVWPLARPRVLGLLTEKLPFFALAVASAWVTYRVQETGGATVTLERLSALDRVANASLAYGAYLVRTVWPSDLAVFYPHAGMVGQPPLAMGLAALTAVGLLGLTVAAGLLAWRGRALWLVGWLWFLGVMVPMIGLVQVGFAASADRYTYLPQSGLVLAVACGVGEAVRARPALRTPAAALAIGALLACALAAHAQTARWRDTRTLFDHTLAVTNANEFIHYNYGHWLQQRGEIEQAKAHYRASLEINPQRTDAAVNLGALLFLEGERERGVAILEESVRLRPGHALANFNYAHALDSLDRSPAARRFFERALACDPPLERDAELRARGALIRLLTEAGEPLAALPHYEAVLALEPSSTRVLRDLAWLYATSADERRPARARELAQRALSLLEVPDAASLDTAAAAEAAAGNFAAARELEERALSALASGDPRALRMRARLAGYARGEPYTDPRSARARPRP